MTGIVVALMITFLISGIWHGATLTFILWGVIQGIYLSVEAVMNKKKTNFEQKHNLGSNRFYILLCCVSTYLLFAFSQIFGRAASAPEVFLILRKIATQHGPLYIDAPTLSYAFMGMILLFIKDFFDEFFPDRYRLFDNGNIAVRYASYLSVSVLIMLIGVFDGGQFIYFQF